MDLWQGSRQIAYWLGLATWADSPSDTVLTGGAFVSEDREGNFLPGDFLFDGPESLSLPFARVSCISVEPDPEQPLRVDRAVFRAWVVAGGSGVAGASGTNDSHGIDQVTGANRATTLGQGKSTGREVDEVIGRLLESFGSGQLVNSTHGLQGYVSALGGKIPVDGVQIIARAIDFVVHSTTVARFYHTSRRFVAAASGGGAVALSWLRPPVRFDRRGGILRRGSAGGSAPTSVTDGTSVSISGSVLGTAATATGLTVGQAYWFSLFESCDETGSATEERYSSPVTAYVVVT